MKEVGKLQKYDGPFLECLIRRSDTYNDVVERGALVLGLHVKTQKTMCLFKPRGQIIPATELVVDGKKVMWTAGNYMRKLHISPEQLPLGIGWISEVLPQVCWVDNVLL